MSNILIVTNSPGGGGAERAMHLLANVLHDHGFPIVVVQVNKEGKDSVELRSGVHNLGRDHKSGALSLLMAISRFRRCVRFYKPKVLVLNCDLPELLALFLPSEIPLIVVEHANPAWSTRILLGRLVRFLHIRRNTTFVAVSDHLKIWPNMLTPSSVNENLVLTDDNFKVESSGSIKRLLFVGRLASIQKRPEVVLEISAAMGIPAVFIGHGPALPSLQSLANKLSIKADFIGFMGDPWSAIQAGDLLIVPSKFEGDGLVVVEALARRIPILLSDIPDFRRFNLNERNYCIDLEEFIRRATEYRDDVAGLVASEILAEFILGMRAPTAVLAKWKKVFESF
jgi:glycosyltransferase involved in cell wall biosynthesis